MKQLQNKRVILGVTGGIAAYKSAELVRRLRAAKADIRVVMTRSATQFVTPLTFQAVSGKPVHLELLDVDEESAMGHITLARWADVIVIAPATANFLARLTHGIADDLLSTLCLASAVPIVVAPAMNRLMWQNPATRENCRTLEKRGITFFGPDDGEQACGETGPGRMLEPDQIAQQLAACFTNDFGNDLNSVELSGLNVLVTAGPTLEDIDPVRYLGNRSSGKMGYAIARAAAQAGAHVTLISGPVNLEVSSSVECIPAECIPIETIKVRSALEMHGEVMERAEHSDIFIAAAAVADFRPKQVSQQKIKRGGGDGDGGLILELEPNPDTLASVAAIKSPPFTVGFAAETEAVETNARSKLEKKAVDMIAANRVGYDDGGFDSDKNALIVLWQQGEVSLPLMSKSKLATHLISIIKERYDARDTTKDS